MQRSNTSQMKALIRQKLLQLFALLLFFVLVTILVPEAAKATGKDSGGGGGTVHDLFIAAGFRVIHYLENYSAGQQLVAKYNLNTCRLRTALDEDLVFVYDDTDEMRDHRGSIVDAYTYSWRIHIDKA